MTRPVLGLVIVGLGASLAPLDIAVNVALPAITAHFGLALGDVQWLVICYVLVYGSLMLVCGKLGDLFGHRLIFRIGLVVSAIGCAACAAAPDWPLFLWARASQGIGTALALSCTPALATSLFPESARTRALAGFASTMAIAAAVGPFLGGALVELWGWPAVYWIRVPIALVTLALSGLLPSPKPNSRPFDAPGAVLLALCMSTLLLSLVLSQRRDVAGIWAATLFAVALAVLFVYVRRANQVPEPIIRPALFVDAAFVVPNIMNVLANLAGFSILLLTPYYLVNVLHLSAVMSGLVLALAFAGSLTGAPLAAFFVRRIGQRPTAFAGVALVGLGLLPLALHRRRDAARSGGAAADYRGRGAGPAHRRLHRHRDGHALAARPRRCRQPCLAHAHLGHRERCLGADRAAGTRRGRPRRAGRVPRRLPLRFPRRRRRLAVGAGSLPAGAARLVAEDMILCLPSAW